MHSTASHFPSRPDGQFQDNVHSCASQFQNHPDGQFQGLVHHGASHLSNTTNMNEALRLATEWQQQRMAHQQSPLQQMQLYMQQGGNSTPLYEPPWQLFKHSMVAPSGPRHAAEAAKRLDEIHDS
jgi:hypothetical protein